MIGFRLNWMGTSNRYLIHNKMKLHFIFMRTSLRITNQRFTVSMDISSMRHLSPPLLGSHEDPFYSLSASNPLLSCLGLCGEIDVWKPFQSGTFRYIKKLQASPHRIRHKSNASYGCWLNAVALQTSPSLLASKVLLAP